MIPEYAEIKRCSKCGLVPTFTGVCPHCGEKLNDPKS